MAKGDNGKERTNGRMMKTGPMTTKAMDQGGATKASREKPATATARGGDRGRSGGVVDAPGKKHRKPMPPDPGANIVHSQVEKARVAKTMTKTSRRRGRG